MAVREIKKLRKQGMKIEPVEVQGRKIARTFWGEAWCSHLEKLCTQQPQEKENGDGSRALISQTCLVWIYKRRQNQAVKGKWLAKRGNQNQFDLGFVVGILVLVWHGYGGNEWPTDNNHSCQSSSRKPVTRVNSSVLSVTKTAS